MKKKQRDAETAALAEAIIDTDTEIRRLETQIAGMRSANQRRGVELAKRLKDQGRI
jgi:hypothetical protein